MASGGEEGGGDEGSEEFELVRLSGTCGPPSAMCCSVRVSDGGWVVSGRCGGGGGLWGEVGCCGGIEGMVEEEGRGVEYFNN